MDIDVIINNIFIDLAKKGSLNDIFRHKDISLKDISIERKVFPLNNPSFPADIILFSKKYTYFLVIEVKNITSTSLNVTQADNYTKLTPDSFVYVSLNPSQIRHDVSYLSEEKYHSFVSGQISSNDFDFPVISVDLEKFTIGFKNKSNLKVSKISKIFNDGIQLKIDDINDIPRHINFGVQSGLDEIARVAVTELIAQVQKKGEEVSISEITEHSFSNISFLWDRIDPAYKKNLRSRVNKALRQLINRGVYPITLNNDKCNIDIFDINKRISISKLKKIQKLIQDAVNEMSGQGTLFDSVSN